MRFAKAHDAVAVSIRGRPIYRLAGPRTATERGEEVRRVVAKLGLVEAEAAAFGQAIGGLRHEPAAIAFETAAALRIVVDEPGERARVALRHDEADVGPLWRGIEQRLQVADGHSAVVPQLQVVVARVG